MNEMSYIVVAVLTLGGVALLAAVVLYIVSRRFAVKEDPRVKDVQECLPGANCGGCGFAGCAALAEALVKGADKGSLDGLRCPVGGDEAMGKIADVLGMAAQVAEPRWRWCAATAVATSVARWLSMKVCTPVRLSMLPEQARAVVAMAVWAVATVPMPASLAASSSIPLPDFPKSTNRCVPAVAVVPRHVLATSSNCARRAPRVVASMWAVSTKTADP